MIMKVVTFGEIMLRLSPPNYQRFSQARSFDIIYGGSESNVAASLVNYGLSAEFVTRLPANDLGDACLKFLKQSDIGTHFIVRGGERLGTYFVEMGAIQRASQVIYDRSNSSFADIKPDMIDWNSVFADATWFHWSGITPAVSAGAADVCLQAVKIAKEHGLTVSCDLNYREKLWKWGKLPSEIMPELIDYADVIIGNGEAAEKCFGIKVPDANAVTGNADDEGSWYLCKNLAKRFINLKTIAITLRSSISANHNSWSGVLWNGSDFYKGPRYEITHIVDRFGSGDSFVGGLIYGLLFYDSPQLALNYALAASCLKHTVFGDVNLVSKSEVERLMMGDGSGRVSR
jgi:2-dehydro-3-deoxygluconokinase